MKNYNITISKQEKIILQCLYNSNSEIYSILHLTRIIFNDQSIIKTHAAYISIYRSIYSLVRKSFIKKEKHFT